MADSQENLDSIPDPVPAWFTQYLQEHHDLAKSQAAIDEKLTLAVSLFEEIKDKATPLIEKLESSPIFKMLGGL